MQMNALRSANLAKLSSSNATSDAYWLTSMSAGTPGGYCLSQIRSMGLSLESSEFVLCLHPERRPGRVLFPAVWPCGGIWQADARYRRIGRATGSGVDVAKPLQINGEVAPVNRPAWLPAWALLRPAWPALALPPRASPRAWRRRPALPQRAAPSAWPQRLPR